MTRLFGYVQLLRLLRSPPALFRRLYALPWYRGALELWTAPLIRAHDADFNLLEIGCAGGDLSQSLAAQGVEVWAVDRSAAMLAMARKATGAVKFVQANAESLPFPVDFFDVVIAGSLINVVDDARSVLKEMRRVSKNGGTVSVLVPDKTFTDQDAKRFAGTEKMAGFSRAAFMAWCRLGRKMDVNDVVGYFNECGFVDVETSALLGGMLASVTGRVE